MKRPKRYKGYEVGEHLIFKAKKELDHGKWEEYAVLVKILELYPYHALCEKDNSKTPECFTYQELGNMLLSHTQDIIV